MKWIEWNETHIINVEAIRDICLIKEEVILTDFNDEEFAVKEFYTEKEAKDFYEEIKSKLTRSPLVQVDLLPLDKERFNGDSCRPNMPIRRAHI